jgi:hypothetical protein
MKNLCYSVIAIVEELSKGNQAGGKYQNGRGLLDSRMRLMLHIPALPHVPQVYFKNGISHMAKNDSGQQKSRASHSLGKIPSSHCVTLLFFLYFALGDDGKVLPNDSFDFSRYSSRMDEQGGKPTGKRTKVVTRIQNLGEKVLTAISSVLSIYFECKRATHTKTSINNLRSLVTIVQANYMVVWELLQILVGKERTFMMRKPHFLVHFPDYISLLGSLRHIDTSVYERSHKWFTTRVWNATSKRYHYRLSH